MTIRLVKTEVDKWVEEADHYICMMLARNQDQLQRAIEEVKVHVRLQQQNM